MLFILLSIYQVSGQELLLQEIAFGKFYFSNGDSLYMPSLTQEDQQLIVFLFHAEQDTIGLDPGLSIQGRYRAIKLLNLMKNIPFAAYYTTPFRNNILTLQPLVDKNKAEIQYYDQADIKALVKKIEYLFPQPVIIMVHPETVRDLVHQLAGGPIDINIDGNKADKLFFLERSRNQEASLNSCKYNFR